MGYANPAQIDSGLHLRLFARSFVVEEKAHPGNVVAFVSIDQGMASQIVKTEVARLLAAKYGSNIFSHKNIMISATHTHSGPGGFYQYLLYVITSKGFIKESYQAIVDGIVRSLSIAYDSRADGHIFHNEGHVHNASVNRSPLSYLANPESERQKYPSNVDTGMTVLKFVREQDKQAIGMFSWFPVHGVSMNESNTLISSDNKGLAALMFEKDMNGADASLGKGPFVAAFAQANEGDVTPNTAGPRCIDTGEPCDNLSSTCGGRVEKCIAFGPGVDMFESTKIIARLQYLEAKGPLRYVHQNIDMTDRSVEFVKDGKKQKGRTCKPAMGYSFAAGTTDGPGAFDFRQGMKNGTLLWDLVRNFIKKPSQEMIDCQAPKPVLLAVGEIEFPYEWVPFIVETQVFQLGSVLMAGLPGEFTTMSGRRIRENMLKTALESQPYCKENFNPKISGVRCRENAFQVVLAGLSNVYTDYIATFEEYQVQRYEAASTIYGQHTLQAYIDQFNFLTASLGKEVESGPETPFFVDKLYSLVPGVVFDSHPYKQPFGFVTKQPKVSYGADEVAEVEFIAANPRNDLRLEDTYLAVEMQVEGVWKTKFTDSNWETKLFWSRKGYLDEILGRSYVTIQWSIKDLDGVCARGTYRIRHYGNSKSILGTISQYSGVTNQFAVVC
ncbi:Neutral ceramidase [Cichlidogyrus casuarinus]|uniref:Neutral ceramidase n=1 Tax=Cichlidogyrus casuarinus TaxID=1844966 RepID=A0ABD2Q2D5_9PLAT